MHLTETVASTKILSGARLFSLPINNVVNRYRLLLVEVQDKRTTLKIYVYRYNLGSRSNVNEEK